MGRVFRPRRRKSDGKIWVSPKWYVEFRDASGTQRRFPASTSKKEAFGVLGELEAIERRRSLGFETSDQREPSIELFELIRLYLNDARIRLRTTTFETYNYSLEELFLKEDQDGVRVGEGLSLRDINITWATKYQHRALDRSTPRTINKNLRTVSQMMNWAVRSGFIRSNPLQHLRMLPQKPIQEPRALSHDEVQALMNASSGEAQSVWRVFLETGMRKGELASLAWNQVDFDRRLITISRGKSKNHKSRIIPMTEGVHQILKAIRRNSPHGKTAPVFSKIEGRSCFYNGCLDVFKRYCSQLGIRGVNIHSLRRTFTVRMLEAGVSPAVVQRLLGHSTANLTLELYAKVNTEDLSRAVGLLQTLELVSGTATN
jgi:integrase